MPEEKIGKTKVYVSVNLGKLKKHRLPKLEALGDEYTPQAAALKALEDRSDEDLVLDNILIGAKARQFRDWFNAHAEFIETLRDRIPARGRNNIEIVAEDGTAALYTWSEFCLQFFGVSHDWVRKLILMHQGMREDPKCGMNAPAEPKPRKKKDAGEAAEERESYEEAKNTALKAENLAMQYRLELRNLMVVVAQCGSSLPQTAQDYLKELEGRLKAIESAFATPAPAKGLDIADGDELQTVTADSVGDLLDELDTTVKKGKKKGASG